MELRYKAKVRGGNNAKDRAVRKRFIYWYENTYGNVSKSSDYTGISRQTYYRWMKGDSSLDRWFQRKIDLTRPSELKKDHAEMALLAAVMDGKVWAIKFVLRR